MNRSLFAVIFALLLTPLAAHADIVAPDPGQRDGWAVDTSTGNLLGRRAGTTVFTVSSAGALTTTTSLTITDDLTVTGNDITFGNAGTISNATNGALTFGEASEDLIYTFTANTVTVTSSTAVASLDWQIATTTLDALVLSDSVTLSDGLTIDQSGNNILTIAENSEDIELTFAADAVSLASTTGVASFAFNSAIAVDVPTPALALDVIRFCGNGSATGIADYMGPVREHIADDMTIYQFGGTGCDALNAAAVGDADEVWHTSFAFTPVAMTCTGRCTGATAANDAITYTLYDDTAASTTITCTAGAWAGDDDVKSCTVRDIAPTAVAAGSAIAIETIGTDDACEATGDDFECRLFITY